MVPELPTATSNVSDRVTPVSSDVVGVVLSVQVIPPGDVITVPLPPTIINRLSDPVTSFKYWAVVGDVLWVHITPSGDVRIVVIPPIATNCEPDHAIQLRLF
jgi:hypothetical protein